MSFLISDAYSVTPSKGGRIRLNLHRIVKAINDGALQPLSRQGTPCVSNKETSTFPPRTSECSCYGRKTNICA
jgi:hypothetical protein